MRSGALRVMLNAKERSNSTMSDITVFADENEWLEVQTAHQSLFQFKLEFSQVIIVFKKNQCPFQLPSQLHAKEKKGTEGAKPKFCLHVRSFASQMYMTICGWSREPREPCSGR